MTIEELDKKIKLESDIAAEARKRVSEYERQRAAELARQAAENVVGKCYKYDNDHILRLSRDEYIRIHNTQIRRMSNGGPWIEKLGEVGISEIRAISRPIFAKLYADIFGEAMPDAKEKDRRVYYQNIVYEVCNILNGRRGEGSSVICGTLEMPSTGVQDLLRKLLSDDPANDGTDTVHPAYKRGEQAGRESSAKLIRQIVLGEVDFESQKMIDRIHAAISPENQDATIQQVDPVAVAAMKLAEAICEWSDGMESLFEETDIKDKRANEAFAAYRAAKLAAKSGTVADSPIEPNLTAEDLAEIAKGHTPLADWPETGDPFTPAEPKPDPPINFSTSGPRKPKKGEWFLSSHTAIPILCTFDSYPNDCLIVTPTPPKLPDGYTLPTGYEYRGEFRNPKRGDRMLCYRSDKVMFALSELLDIPENYRPIVYPIAPISNDESDSSGTPKERVQAVAGNDPSTKVATVRPEPAKGLPTAEAIVQIAVETWYQNVIKISSGFYCVEVVLLIAENLEVARQIRTVLSELISRRDAALLEAHATALNESGDHGAASHLRAKFGKGSAR